MSSSDQDAAAPDIVAICAIMKDEAKNVVEWIAYHRSIGVEKFFLYDNGSSDGTHMLLMPLIERGIVEYVDWPGPNAQTAAYDDCLRRQRDTCGWIAFIDVDEYINIFDGRSLPEWLAPVRSDAAIALQWLNFGPSGHETRQPGLQLSTYLYRLDWPHGVHGHVKTIARPTHATHAIDPHSFNVTGPVLNENLEEIGLGAGAYSVQPVIDHREICINHYYTRSLEDYAAKMKRGRADTLVDDRQMAWYDFYRDHASVFDDRITQRLPAVRRQLEEFRAWGLVVPAF